MNDPREPNTEEFQEPNTGITGEGDVEAYADPAEREPNTEASREPNTE